MTISATSAETPELGYTLWSVLRRNPDKAVAGNGIDEAIAAVEAAGVTIRGFYDVSSVRADADLMIWLHGTNPEKLQWALRELRRSELLVTLLPTFPMANSWLLALPSRACFDMSLVAFEARYRCIQHPRAPANCSIPTSSSISYACVHAGLEDSLQLMHECV